MYDDAWRRFAFLECGYFMFLPLSNRAPVRGRWGLQLRNKTLYTLPQPQRPSRRVYSSGQDERVTKTAACSERS